MLFKLAFKSLIARKVSVGLTVFSICISVFVLLAIGHIKNETKSSFTSTVSGVDLIVGARTGQLNLLLYSVFRIGNATNNIGWESYQKLASSRSVAWTIPISLGDSHRGYRVMGTNEDYFKHFNYSNKRSLSFDEGVAFDDTFDAVLGADVAKQLGYRVGDEITLSHGLGSTSFSEHKNNPFTVVGILNSTGTPVDQTVHVPLTGIEAIHIGWQSGVNLSGLSAGLAQRNTDLTPKTITAFMVGLNSKIATFSFQRQINQHADEALMAILPGVTLAELWRMMSIMENVLLAISILVLIAALIGMSTMMLAAMRERKQEFAVLRAIGASPLFIVVLIQLEAILTTLMSMALAIAVLLLGISATQDILSTQFGLFISSNIFTPDLLMALGAVIISTILVGVFPAISAYRSSKV